jgi:hypothetical protein
MRFLLSSVLIAVSMLATNVVRAQAPALPSAGCGIVGSVLYPDGAIVTGAEIQVTNQESGKHWDAVKSDTKGQFHVPGLPPGNYTVTVSMPEFTTQTIKNIPVPERERYTLPVKLDLGGGVVYTIDAGNMPFVAPPNRPTTVRPSLARPNPGDIHISATFVGIDPGSPDNEKFEIQFYNVAAVPATLVLGDIYPPKSLPDAITLFIKRGGEASRRYTLVMPRDLSVSHDDFVRSLASGDSYALQVKLSQFYDPNSYDLGSKLSQGTYSAQFEFVARYRRLCDTPPRVGTAVAPCLMGTKATEWVSFTVPAH